VLWQTVYRPDKTGMIDSILVKLGLHSVDWLSNPAIALWSVLAVVVWQAVGFYVVLFSAGMASIPKDLFEAAALDGASRFDLFFRVTLPLLWNSLQVGWVYLGIMAFDFFAIVNVLTVGQAAAGPTTPPPCSRTRPTGRPSRTPSSDTPRRWA